MSTPIFQMRHPPRVVQQGSTKTGPGQASNLAEMGKTAGAKEAAGMGSPEGGQDLGS